ncbi:MAG: hygromycin-B 4-O-kinase [Actinomycetota bacterium]
MRQNRDPALVEAFLRERCSGPVRDVAPVGRGDWSVAYAFRSDGADHVARFGAWLEDFEKDRVAAAYASAELPVPQVLEVGEALGGYYAISERAYGTFLEALDERRMRAILPAFFAALDAARRTDLSGTTGYGQWDATGAAPHASWQEALLAVGEDEPSSRTHGWRERLASSPLGDGPLEEALACLRELAPGCPDERHLTHNDLLNRNVLVADGRLQAVFDWGNSTHGDFVYELAQFTFWAPWHPAWRGVDLADEAQRHYERIGLDVPGFEQRLRAYEIRIALDGCTYNAFRERWDELEATTRRLRPAVERQPVEPT